jgi:molecular chaperone HscB
MRFYESLGLERKLALDAEHLKKRFYERSRQWHPDRFSRAPAADQQKALEMTALLNDAFRTLRDPVARAGYFLRESGLDLSQEPPAELLEEVFELNLALEELRRGDESVRPQLDAARERFQGMLEQCGKELEALFERHDRAPGEPVLQEIRAALNRRKYVANLVGQAILSPANSERELDRRNVHAAD